MVDTFEYLGRKLNNSADDSAEVKNRIGKAWQAFNKYKEIITHKALSMKRKRSIIKTYVIPCALYAAETVVWTPQLMRQMNVFDNHIMRWMCGKKLSDRITIDRLRELTNLPPIQDTIITTKLKYFGHIKRSNLPVKTMIEGLIQGRRTRGRPTRRWLDDVIEWTQKSVNELNSLVKDRKRWRAITLNHNSIIY